MLTDALQEIREARFFFGVADHKGLLRLPDPTGGVALDGRLSAGGLFAGDARFQNVEAHHVLGGVVQDEREEIEVNDGVQARGEVVEKRGKIALLGNSFADFEQGFELAPGVFERRGERRFRRRNDVIRHNKQNSTRAGEGSTEGMAGSQFASDEAALRTAAASGT
jgi:hypothetical protein